MRLFIALYFPQEIKEEIEKTRERLVSQFPQVAWTKKENIHLTLKFLGNIRKTYEESQILLENIKEEMKKIVQKVKPFSLVFEKIGFFEREQLIIWLGTKKAPELSFLVELLDENLEKFGFRKERREFTPHITLGRGKRLEKKILSKIKEAMWKNSFPLPSPFTVSSISLINSVLSPRGPFYEEVASFPFLL